MVDILNMTGTNKMPSNDQMSGLIRLFTELRLDDKVSSDDQMSGLIRLFTELRLDDKLPSDDQTPGLPRLPPELRLQIYDFLWPPLSPAQEVIDEVSSCNVLTKGALLYTCHQLRAETEPIFYSRHAFIGNLSFLDVQPFITWLYDIGAYNVKLMPKVILHWHIPQHYMEKLKTLGCEFESARKAYAQATVDYENPILAIHNVEATRQSERNASDQFQLQAGLLNQLVDQIVKGSVKSVTPLCKAVLNVPGIDGFKVEVPSPRSCMRTFARRSGEDRVVSIRSHCQYRMREIRAKEIENAFVGRVGGYEWLSIE